jgi:ABC-2 type transport system ATP-binding protein
MPESQTPSLPVRVSKVSKRYADGHRAVRNVSFDIHPGQFTVLLGLNGAGKTSLISMLTGLNYLTSGTIEIFGNDIASARYLAQRQMGIMSQEVNLNPFITIIDAIITHGGYYGICKDDAVNRAMPLLQKARLHNKINLPISGLSGGMKRILMLIRCLIQKPNLLILDEPTANLDIEIRQIIWELLRHEHENGMTTLLTTHNLEEAQLLCTHVLILHQGKIVMDRPIEEAIQGLEEKFYTVCFDHDLEPKQLDMFSAYSGTLIAPNNASFCLRKDQDLGLLVYKMHLAELKINHLAPSSHQLEQLLREATL